jgi:hypothetical protein
VIAGIVLLLFGLLTLLTGVILIVAGTAVGQLGDAFASAGVPGLESSVGSIVTVMGVAIAFYGGLEVLGSIGVFARRGWGRAIGIVVSVIGVLFGLLTLVAAAATDTADGRDSGLFVALVILVAYAFSLLALALGGHAFRRSA